MVFGLFSEKATVDVTADRQSYRPGETVRIEIRARGQEALAIRGARAELVITHKYKYRTTTASNNGGTRTTTHTASDDTVVAMIPLLGEGTVEAGSDIPLSAEIQIPAGAPPSGEGSATSIWWSARAVLDVPRRPDADGQTSIVVLAPRDAHPSGFRAPTLDTRDCHLTMTLDDDVLRAGSTIRGTLHLAARSPFEARAVRVELVRREEVSRDRGYEDTEVVSGREIASLVGSEVAPGDTHEFPFELLIPSRTFPSHTMPPARVSWSIRAVVDRPRRDAFNLEQPVHIYNAD